MPDASGVMLALVITPHGVGNVRPPARYMPVRGCILSSTGVWHVLQLPMRTRYSPRFSAVERSGFTVAGSGKVFRLASSGGGRLVFGNGLCTGGTLRTYAITDARSSSESSVKLR